ncbi:pyridoxamine 5'-phosphate oxidase family protein [Algoriphagus sediminis]|uniref:Pyridoxamine 5'-phosphate oxidase family protein n=1 Tax=Algoriphagus sediminis TaxID=3057113 RepID=A0ABT7YEU4_9BACT|nr:pyridoxamine 5'-phosphate oxidase family protein [Algoriphagus sediminis]MDN3205045.1 pyridoxamine 5'-phosphate oxidase family protein [Algoriphagus sediminis]
MLFDSKNTRDEIWTAVAHELHRGALDSKHAFRYVNLATNGKGYPEIRTVVLRGVDADLNFYIFTDSRSQKVEEIKRDQPVSLHFYHPKKRVQIRVQAKAEIHQNNDLALELWQRVQGNAQKAYNSTFSPGEKIKSPSEGWDWPQEMNSDFFAVIRFKPEKIEALQLDRLNHLRIEFEKVAGEWEGQWLVP